MEITTINNNKNNKNNYKLFFIYILNLIYDISSEALVMPKIFQDMISFE